MVVRICVALVAMLLVGCGSSFQVDVSDDFTPAERSTIEASAAAWVNVGAKGEGTWRVVRAALPPGVEGETDENGGHEIRISVLAKNLRHTVTHEIGHAHGVAHIDEHERGVMCWNEELPSCTDEITDADVAQCRTDGACTP